MKQIGYVTEVANGRAKVRIDRESSCGGNCVSCKGCPQSALVAECVSDGELKVGDRAEVSMPTGGFFRNVFLGYGTLVILVIAFAVLGYIIFKSDIASVVGAVFGLALGIVLLKLCFKGRDVRLVAVRKTEDTL